MPLEVINPATGKTINAYDVMEWEEVDELIQSVQKDWLAWRKTSFKERTEKMLKTAEVLNKRKKEFGRLMTEEMGKPIKQSIGEIEKCALVCEYYAKEAESFLKPEMIVSDASKSYVGFEPLGIVFAIMPWNFPFWQVFRFCAPALMAGNAGVLKHSENVTGCALAIEEVLHEAGFPENIFRTLIIDVKHAKNVIEHQDVKAVTLTGSTRAGKAVASQAGAVIKKCVLELGGSDPYIVLEDADLDQAVDICVQSRMINGGQSCVAAKRFIVASPLKEAFEKKFVKKMQAMKMGDPLEENVNLGPLARFDLRDELHKQVTRSINQGAKLLCGGEVPDADGAYYPPTVLTDVQKGMAAYEEELFGPVATIIEAKDENEAIAIANDSIYGLGGAVFTQDVEKGERLAKEELQAGCCFVNAFVRSDPRLPFGGIKESGYGRELSSFGIREFTNHKTVYVS